MNLESKGKPIAVAGAILQLGLLVGVVGTVVGMMKAFQALGADNVSDPRVLAQSIGDVLIFTAIGLAFAVAGFVFICIAFFGSRYRARWFFWFLIDYGIILLLAYPVGMAMGICMILFAILHRREFFIPAKNALSRSAPETGRLN